MVDLRALLNLRVLHDDGVLHHSALGDLDAAEEDGVDDGALDDAAVGHQGVGALALVVVAGGHVVADLGVDRALRREQLAAHLVVLQRHVEVEVGLDGVDLRGQVGVLIAADLERAVVDGALHDVAVEVVQAVGGRLLHQLAQQLAAGDVDLHERTLAGGHHRADLHAGDGLVFVHGDVGGVLGVGALEAPRVHEGDVRAGVDVLLDGLGEVRVVDGVAVGHHDVLLGGQAQEVAVGVERVQKARVHAHVLARQERRENGEALLAVEVPLAAGADVVHQGLVVLLGDDADVLDAGVHHGRELEVDDAVTARDRERGDRAKAGQFTEMDVVFTGEDKTHDVFHVGVPPYCASASI